MSSYIHELTYFNIGKSVKHARDAGVSNEGILTMLSQAKDTYVSYGLPVPQGMKLDIAYYSAVEAARISHENDTVEEDFNRLMENL